MTGGNRFCIEHEPAISKHEMGVIVYVHPFADEMNKCRRMSALQARAFADSGYRVLQIDLFGCGDSAGDFGDATWQQWVDDVVQACHWIRGRSTSPLWLWGLRAGCLIASAAARQLDGSLTGMLFWQPVLQGRTQLQQFLRLKAAATMEHGNASSVLASLRKQLACGLPVEVAGYLVSAGMARGLEAAELSPFSGSGQICWVEITTSSDLGMSPAGQVGVAQWQNAGWLASSSVVNGPKFWQTTEIEDAAQLVPATLAIMGCD